jgi:ferrous iron transport protein A
MKTTDTRPLSQVAEGEIVSIVEIEGGRGLRGRLTTMGLLPKTQIRVVRNGGSGPFVISIGNTRVALGRGVVDKIIVA